MAIPNGYRLLTAEDVGKVFGVDLELEVYIDTYTLPSVSIAQNTTINLTNFMTYTRYYDDMDGEGSMLYYLNELIFNMGWLMSEDNLTTTNGLKVETYYTDSDWNDFFYVKDKSDPKTQFITDMDGLAKSIVDKAGSSGKKTIKEMKTLIDGLKTEFVTQEKTVTPTKASQAITPDSGKDGLSKVTVNSIPDEYIVPSGTLNITENGIYDVSEKANVNINVSSAKPEQSKSVTPTKSQQEVTPDSGYTLNKVVVNAIPDEYIIPNGTMEITENGSYDVTDKASVVVNVPGIIAEQWDGAYEEIVSGFTLTLEKSTNSKAKTDDTNIANIKYSVNDGVEQTLTLPLTLSNVSKISFSCVMAYGLLAGTTATGTDLISDYDMGVPEYSQDLTKDTTIYIGLYTGPFIC